MLQLAELSCRTDLDNASHAAEMIEDYMQRHFTGGLSLRRAALAMNCSEHYFSRLFKRCFHQNFAEHLTGMRIKKAMELFPDPLPQAKDISVQVGFQDHNYFTKVFRKRSGKAPTAYRASCSQKAPVT